MEYPDPGFLEGASEYICHFYPTYGTDSFDTHDLLNCHLLPFNAPWTPDFAWSQPDPPNREAHMAGNEEKNSGSGLLFSPQSEPMEGHDSHHTERRRDNLLGLSTLEQPRSDRAAAPRPHPIRHGTKACRDGHTDYIRYVGQVQRPRFRTLVLAAGIAAGELACIAFQRGYESCHGDPAELSRTCASFTTTLPHTIHIWEQPSTEMFIFSALAYGALAAQRYYINRYDRYQHICLTVGVLAGIAACYPSLVDPEAHRAFVSPLALAITATLTVSTLGHFLVGLLFRFESVRDVPTQDTMFPEKEMDGSHEYV